MERSWDVSAFNEVSIVSDEVFFIKIIAGETSKIKLEAKASGEYCEYVVLDISEEKNKLQIATGYTPYFEAANDKLAAHKVMSIQLELLVPENMAIKVFSKLASFYGEGRFKNAEVILEDGQCVFALFKGNAKIKTRNGNVVVSAKGGVAGTAISNYGTVINNLPSTGKYKIKVQSVNGDITLAVYP